MSPEIDKNIFKPVTLTTWFVYVVFRLVKLNNIKKFKKKARKAKGIAYFTLRLSIKTY